MLKRLLSITLLSVALFISCKKDAPAYPTPVAPTPEPPFVLQDNVFPNPCQGKFTISTNTPDSQNVSLSDMTGNLLLNLTIKGTTTIVDNSLVNGVYYLHFSSKYGTHNQKILIVK